METKIFHKILNEIPTYTRFLKVSEIDNLINLIYELPDVKYEKIGKTVDNEPLGMLEIGKNDKTALIIGVPHSDEPLGSLVITFFARWLATHPELNCFGWRWLFIPILERRGMCLNEGWFNIPESLAAMAKSSFREPTEDQYEWTFPIEYEDFKWTQSRPETIAIKDVLEREKPELLCNLHHSGFTNGYYYLSKDFPEIYPELSKFADSLRIPLSDKTPDVPFGKMFSPGFYQMYGLKDYLEYYKKKDPLVLPALRRGACSDEWYQKNIGGFSFNCEVPMYLSHKLKDKNPSKRSYKKMIEQRYKRKKSRLEYSIMLIEKLKEYGVEEFDAEKLLEDLSEDRVERIKEGRLDQSKTIRKFFLNSALRKTAVSMSAGETDEPVTCDVKRLIRMPGSLHGKTGFKVEKITLDSLLDFDPLIDTIVFSDDPVKVQVNQPFSIKLNNEEFALKQGVHDLPRYLAIFLIGRKLAFISDQS